jgi:hypothetical protein
MLFTIEEAQPKGMAERTINTTNLLTPEEKVARRQFAERFLGEVLLPVVARGSLTNAEEITQLYSAFQNNKPDLGSGCSLMNVWYYAFEKDLQNDCVAKTNPAQLPDNAPHLATAVQLLEQVLFNDDEDE